MTLPMLGSHWNVNSKFRLRNMIDPPPYPHFMHPSADSAHPKSNRKNCVPQFLHIFSEFFFNYINLNILQEYKRRNRFFSLDTLEWLCLTQWNQTFWSISTITRFPANLISGWRPQILFWPRGLDHPRARCVKGPSSWNHCWWQMAISRAHLYFVPNADQVEATFYPSQETQEMFKLLNCSKILSLSQILSNLQSEIRYNFVL